MCRSARAWIWRYAQAPASIAEFKLFANNTNFANAIAANGSPERRAYTDERDSPQPEVFGGNARYRRGSDSRGVAEPADCAVNHFPSLKVLRVIPRYRRRSIPARRFPSLFRQTIRKENISRHRLSRARTWLFQPRFSRR